VPRDLRMKQNVVKERRISYSPKQSRHFKKIMRKVFKILINKIKVPNYTLLPP
jgi:hypothetical protein